MCAFSIIAPNGIPTEFKSQKRKGIRKEKASDDIRKWRTKRMNYAVQKDIILTTSKINYQKMWGKNSCKKLNWNQTRRTHMKHIYAGHGKKNPWKICWMYESREWNEKPERMAHFRSIHLGIGGKNMNKKQHRKWFSFKCHMRLFVKIHYTERKSLYTIHKTLKNWNANWNTFLGTLCNTWMLFKWKITCLFNAKGFRQVNDSIQLYNFGEKVLFVSYPSESYLSGHLV